MSTLQHWLLPQSVLYMVRRSELVCHKGPSIDSALFKSSFRICFMFCLFTALAPASTTSGVETERAKITTGLSVERTTYKQPWGMAVRERKRICNQGTGRSIHWRVLMFAEKRHNLKNAFLKGHVFLLMNVVVSKGSFKCLFLHCSTQQSMSPLSLALA